MPNSPNAYPSSSSSLGDRESDTKAVILHLSPTIPDKLIEKSRICWPTCTASQLRTATARRKDS